MALVKAAEAADPEDGRTNKDGRLPLLECQAGPAQVIRKSLVLEALS